jgi:aspartate aminotransferase
MLDKANRMREAGRDIVNFCVGEPDFDTPEYVIDEAKRALDAGRTRYTATGGVPKLREAIAKKLLRDNGLKYEPEQIVASNGCKQSLFNTLMALVNAGDEVILFSPYWLTYPEIVKLVGGVPVVVNCSPENGFVPTAEQLSAAITPKTKLIILNSPNNPTGAVYTKDDICKLAKVIEKSNAYVISDEIYEKLIFNGTKHYSIATYSKKLYDKTITINGLSKAYAMTGWRVGYSAANPEVANAISRFQSHITQNINTPSQYAAIEALSNPAGDTTIQNMVAEFKKRSIYMRERISKMPHVSYTVPNGAFYIMLDIRKLGRDAITIADELLEKINIVTVPCPAFGMDGFVRFSYALSMDEIKKGMDRLEEYLQNYQIPQ